MIKLGITGNIACGKSLVESMLQEKGICVIDADKIVHDLYEKIDFQERIKILFKDEDIFEKNTISRQKISAIVFKNKKKLKELEQILHPAVKEEVKKFFNDHKNEKLVCASIPLLFESEMHELFDIIITIIANRDIQMKRLTQRRGLSSKEAIQRIDCQMPQEEKARRADYIIDNSGFLESTKNQLEEILRKLEKNY